MCTQMLIYAGIRTQTHTHRHTKTALTIGFFSSLGFTQRTKNGWHTLSVLISISRERLNWLLRVGERFLVSTPCKHTNAQTRLFYTYCCTAGHYYFSLSDFLVFWHVKKISNFITSLKIGLCEFKLHCLFTVSFLWLCAFKCRFYLSQVLHCDQTIFNNVYMRCESSLPLFHNPLD